MTVLFADVAGSTQMGSEIDPESMRRLLSRHFAAMREVVERHGGTVEKFIGDAVMAVFGVPTVHEDDALRAVRAAADMRAAVAALNSATGGGPAIALRTGINTGVVVAGDPATGETMVTGDTVNVAARLEQAAEPGEILLGSLTWDLVRDAVIATPAGPYVAKGKEQPVPAYRLESVGAATEGHARRLAAPLVDRERELRALRRAYEDALADQRCHLVTVLGPAGIGKTRLVAELLASDAADARVLRGRCPPYGAGMTLWPLREQLAVAADIGQADAETASNRLAAFAQSVAASPAEGDRVASALSRAIGLTSETVEREELFWAVGRAFEGLATGQPLVVVFDDLHWAEQTLLDLIESLADTIREAPVVLVGLARPELLELRPNWGGGKVNATTMLLEPLPAADMARLVDNATMDLPLTDATRNRVVDAAEGLPLYVEELVGMLRADSATEMADLPVPPSLQAIVAARLDRLDPAETACLERAAVIGRGFSSDAVLAMLPAEDQGAAQMALASLVRKEIIRPDRSAGPGAYRFRNAMMRDTVYASTPKELRAELHAGAAEWLAGAEPQRAPELAELVGYHYEQAFLFRRQLEGLDGRTRSLALQAAAALAAAGRRAYARHDSSAVLSLLGRATALLDLDDRDRLELELLLAETRRQSGDLQESGRLLQSVGQRAADAGFVGTSAKAEILGLWLRGSTDDPRDWHGDVTALTDRLRTALETAGDADALALMWGIRLDSVISAGSIAAAREAAQQTLDQIATAGDPWQVGRRARANLAELSTISDEPIDAALERCAGLLADGGGDRRLASAVLASMGRLHAMAGNQRAAEDATTDAVATADELGLLYARAFGMQAAGFAARMAGDSDRAIDSTRRSLELLLERGDHRAANRVRLDYAEALLEAGRLAQATDAIAALATADEHAGPANVTLRRGIEAILAATDGDQTKAYSLAAQAVDAARATDSPVWLARALGHQAWVSAIGQDAAGRGAAADEATALWLAKGATGGAAHLAALLTKR